MIDVAVIPAAGNGTRMRPATRMIPKPLIPVLEKPVIQYVVEEAVEAGVTEVIFVTDGDDRILQHFTSAPLPESERVHFRVAVQDEPRGLGHAVLCARDAVGDRPFLVQLSDMFPVPGRSFTGRLTALGRPCVAVEALPPEYYERYGFVAPVGDPVDGVVRISGAVEKPGSATPSNLGLVGRYVFPSALFDVLAGQEPGHGGEIQLTDAIDVLARTTTMDALIVADSLLDTGIPLGLAEATVAVALRRPDLAEEFRQILERELGITDRGLRTED